MQISRLVYLIFALTLSFSCFAQQRSTVGEVLDKGGIKLNKEEMQQLFAGATMTGLQASNNLPYKLVHKSGGLVEGHGSTPSASVSGTWTINDQGQLCHNMQNNTGRRFGDCNFFYKANDDYFSANNEDRGTVALERKIGK